MTFFITTEYLGVIVPLMVVLLGALVSYKRDVTRLTVALAAAGLVWTWPATPSEAFSRAWAHDRLTALATVGLLIAALARPGFERLVLLFGALVCAGANDVVLLLCGAWLGLTEIGRTLLACATAVVLCLAGTTELAAAQPAWLALVMLVCAWQSRTWISRAGLVVACTRVVFVTLLPAETAWRVGVLR